MRIRSEEKELLVRKKTVELVAERGLDGWSMHQLAKAAGVATATLYIYFADREDLLVQVCAEVSNRLLQMSLRGLKATTPFGVGLRLQWDNRLAHFREHPLEVAFVEHLRYSPYYQQVLPLLIRSHGDLLGDFLRRAETVGELIPLPYEAYWSLAFAPLYQLFRFDSQQSNAAKTSFKLNNELIAHVFQCVIKSLTP
jgi:AcrR family transcriptional regulator